MRKLLSRKTLPQVAIALLAIILVTYQPPERNKISIAIGKQWSPEKDQPSITLKGFALASGGDLANNKEIFVPVSRAGYQWIQGLVIVLLIGICIVGVWLFIRLPYKVLYNIAKGKPFGEGNTKDLRRIGWGIISIGLVFLIVPLLVRTILASSVPENVYYPFWNALYGSRWWFLLGMTILLVARAFRQGYDLHKNYI